MSEVEEQCPGGRTDYYDCEYMDKGNLEPEWREGERYPYRLVWQPCCNRECQWKSNIGSGGD